MNALYLKFRCRIRPVRPALQPKEVACPRDDALHHPLMISVLGSLQRFDAFLGEHKKNIHFVGLWRPDLECCLRISQILDA